MGGASGPSDRGRSAPHSTDVTHRDIPQSRRMAARRPYPRPDRRRWSPPRQRPGRGAREHDDTDAPRTATCRPASAAALPAPLPRCRRAPGRPRAAPRRTAPRTTAALPCSARRPPPRQPLLVRRDAGAGRAGARSRWRPGLVRAAARRPASIPDRRPRRAARLVAGPGLRGPPSLVATARRDEIEGGWEVMADYQRWVLLRRIRSQPPGPRGDDGVLGEPLQRPGQRRRRSSPGARGYGDVDPRAARSAASTDLLQRGDHRTRRC